MPRTIDSLIASHEAVSGRRAHGLAPWDQRVDVSHVFHADTLPFTERRNRIVAALRDSRWVRDASEFDFLTEIVDNLADADGPDEFDDWWDALYDQADADRVWVNTTGCSDGAGRMGRDSDG